MKFEKGRAKLVDVPDPMESLEGMLQKLAEQKLELKEEKQKYLEKTKHLRESIKSLENVVTEEVKKLHRTVEVGGIRAEYVPQVVIKMKKGKNNGE